jgi:hypothetical protein
MFKSQLKTLSVIVFSSLIISQSYSADDSKKLDVSESAFKCLSALAASGRFFVDNILGSGLWCRSRLCTDCIYP